ncbi:unnamed protein product, partial [Ranitomeya imitator]
MQNSLEIEKTCRESAEALAVKGHKLLREGCWHAGLTLQLHSRGEREGSEIAHRHMQEEETAAESPVCVIEIKRNSSYFLTLLVTDPREDTFIIPTTHTNKS